MKKDTKSKKELEVVEEEGEVFNYSLGAFFGTFIYYIMIGDWKLFLVAFLTTVILPIKDYFLIGLILGFYADKCVCQNVKKPIIRLIILACIGVISFCFLKLIRFHYLGSI